MTWERAAQALADPDAVMEAADPFFVPSKAPEIWSFVCVGFLTGTAVFALVFLSTTTANIVLLLAAGLLGGLLFLRGLKQRRYRVSRMRTVDQLSANLLAEGWNVETN